MNFFMFASCFQGENPFHKIVDRPCCGNSKLEPKKIKIYHILSTQWQMLTRKKHKQSKNSDVICFAGVLVGGRIREEGNAKGQRRALTTDGRHWKSDPSHHTPGLFCGMCKQFLKKIADLIHQKLLFLPESEQSNYVLGFKGCIGPSSENACLSEASKHLQSTCNE